MKDINPGEELRNFLKELYPQNCNDKYSEKCDYFVSRIDFALMAEGQFTKLVYESTINYMLRRLINTAEFLRRKYETDEFPPETFIKELRLFLITNTHISEENSEKVIALLQSCLRSKGKKVKQPRKKRLIKEFASRDELRCYICGRELKEEEIEIEHLWPKTMGGSTEDYNLKLACEFCNDDKQHYIDASDFHYEQICLVNDKNDPNFIKEMKKQYKIAIWAKSGYSCSICNKPASIVGKLNFSRINTYDSWHFLNIEAYCDQHTPE